MSDCVFCKIVNKEIPAEIVYEDDFVMAFKDLKPITPVHLLLITKKHIPTLLDMQEEDAEIMGRLQLAAGKIAREQGFAGTGFRLVSNCGKDAEQIVMHIHYHLIAGRPLNWPPG
ncbi:MAG: histidine triad nucleotide-binding protein [Peptococcaceae bacterium]|nr:histidine triad nucleotide-binding protein [Peptococcaceae bacterium]